jgi:hypothetical protein
MAGGRGRGEEVEMRELCWEETLAGWTGGSLAGRRAGEREIWSAEQKETYWAALMVVC